jgi:glycogen(starch) synthase
VKRILHLIPSLAPCGSATQLRLLAKHLPRDRFELLVLVLGKEAGGPAMLDVDIELLQQHRVIDLQPFLKMRNLIRSFKPDTIHAWGAPSLWTLAIASYGRLAQTIFQPTVRETPDPLSRFLFRRSRQVVVTGIHQLEEYKPFVSHGNKLVLIPPGVEAARSEKPNALSWPGLPENARVIVCLGPIERHKGFHDAIWAFDILKYVHPERYLALVGTGPDRDRLADFVHAVKAQEFVHFAGRVDEVSPFLSSAEIVWIPGLAASGVNAALEAMALGRPVVASRVPALAEIVEDGQTGLLFTPGDKPDLARRTKLLLDDAGLRERCAEAARTRARDHFGVQEMTQRYAELYEA